MLIVRSISTEAMFCSSCSRLDAPGMAATVGLRIAQAERDLRRCGRVRIGHSSQCSGPTRLWFLSGKKAPVDRGPVCWPAIFPV